MASVQKMPGRNRWRAAQRAGGRGSKQITTKWFDNKGDAISAQKAMERARLALVAPGMRLPLLDLVDMWETHQGERRQKRDARYIKEGAAMMRRTIEAGEWGHTTDIARLDVAPYAFRLMKALLRYARDHHQQTVHASALIKPDRERTKRKRAALPSLEDVAHMVARAAEWAPGEGAIAHLVAVYGHRPQSLVQLTPSCLEFSYVGHTPADQPPIQGWLSLKVKGGREVRHPLLPASLELLVPMARETPHGLGMFPSHLGKPWPLGRDFSSWFYKCVGDRRGIYQLKCWAITWMWAGGLDVETISSITGHTTDTVRRYLRTNEEKQQAALAVISRPGALAFRSVLPGATG